MHPKPEAKNSYLNVPEVLLIRTLKHRGLGVDRIPGFFWSLKSCLLHNPGVSLGQLNRQLERLGWGDALLDEQTLQLARVAACSPQEVNS